MDANDTQKLWPVMVAAHPNDIWLLVSPRRIMEIEHVVLPRLALRGNVHVIVGGHAYDADGIMRSLRRLVPDPAPVRRRILQRRAPTAFQMRALLKNTPATPEPLIILNFLFTYFDDEDELWKSRYLLEESLADIHRLSRSAPLIITVRPPAADDRRFCLLEKLYALPARVIEFTPPTAPRQPRMF